MRGFHASQRLGRMSPGGKRVHGYGVRVGYWPCLRGFYVQLSFATRRFMLWWGEPSTPKAQ